MPGHTYAYHIRKTLTLALPVCFGQLGHMMVGFVDTAMVGHIPVIGSKAQAAMNITNSVYMLVLVFGLGISFGMTPLVASADGAKKPGRITELFRNGMLLNLAVGSVLFLFLLFLSPVLRYLKQDPSVVEIAIPFMNVMIFSLVPLSMYSTCKQFAEGLSDTRMAMLISLGGNLMNVLLNYLLIFGHWGFHPMGVMGACWGSFFARVFMAAVMMLYVYYKPSYRQYRDGFKMKGFSRSILKEILGAGVPIGLQWIFEVGAFSFAGLMAGTITVATQAAHQVALTIAACTYMFASGLSSAVAVRTGNAFGRKDINEMRKAGFAGFRMIIVFMFSCALLFIFTRHWLASLLSEDPAVINIASGLLIIAAVFQLSDGLQVVGLGALRGIHDTRFPTLLTLIAYWVVGLPASYLLGLHWHLGVSGIWYGFVIGLSFSAIGLLWRFERISRSIPVKELIPDNVI
ncbi:MAG: MATE family efflux transporter [Bacteroidia bacterium]